MEPTTIGENSDSISPAVTNNQTENETGKYHKLLKRFNLKRSRLRGQKNLHQWNVERLDRLLADADKVAQVAHEKICKGNDVTAEVYMVNALLCLKGQALTQLK